MTFPSDLGYGSCPICGTAIWPTNEKGIYFCSKTGMIIEFTDETGDVVQAQERNEITQKSDSLDINLDIKAQNGQVKE